MWRQVLRNRLTLRDTYKNNQELESLKKKYRAGNHSSNSVPQAIIRFLISRKAISFVQNVKSEIIYIYLKKRTNRFVCMQLNYLSIKME